MVRRLFQNYVFVGLLAGVPTVVAVFATPLGLPSLAIPMAALLIWAIAVIAASSNSREDEDVTPDERRELDRLRREVESLRRETREVREAKTRGDTISAQILNTPPVIARDEESSDSLAREKITRDYRSKTDELLGQLNQANQRSRDLQSELEKIKDHLATHLPTGQPRRWLDNSP